MNTKYIDVADKWGVIVCYDLRRLDEYEMRQDMMAFGMHGYRIDEAADILLFEDNTGMCVSRDDIRMSLIFIGNATSDEQFWDTMSHELYHAACAICDYYEAPHGSEDFAWTIGYLIRQAVLLFGEPKTPASTRTGR